MGTVSLPFSSLQSSIEAIGESMALAEKNGVEPKQVMDLLSSTIFDCLIYKVTFAPSLFIPTTCPACAYSVCFGFGYVFI